MRSYVFMPLKLKKTFGLVAYLSNIKKYKEHIRWFVFIDLGRWVFSAIFSIYILLNIGISFDPTYRLVLFFLLNILFLLSLVGLYRFKKWGFYLYILDELISVIFVAIHYTQSILLILLSILFVYFIWKRRSVLT